MQVSGGSHERHDGSSQRRSSSRDWNFHPSLPIELSPIFAWPPKPLAWLNWISTYWLALSSVTLEVALAVVVYRSFQPDWVTMETLAPGWLFQIWVRNVILICLIAGGLHLWFYGFSAQGKALKFDARDLNRSNGSYTFRNQVLDNMFWTIASGVTAWTPYEVLYFWAAANGYAPRISVAESPIWFVVLMVLIPIWSSFHFYWIHRLLHWPPLYRVAHALHHRNVNIGPWSGISMHPIETAIYFSSLLVHLIIPSHPVHFLLHVYVNGLGPVFSHSGFDGILVKDKKRVETGVFFHQLHHRFFECNYGTVDMPWDRVFGSFHDGSDAATTVTRARKKRMHAPRA